LSGALEIVGGDFYKDAATVGALRSAIFKSLQRAKARESAISMRTGSGVNAAAKHRRTNLFVENKVAL